MAAQIAAYENAGLAPPSEWFAPELLPGADLILLALDQLAGDRPMLSVGMGGLMIRPVPFVALDAFASRHAIDGDDFLRFARLFARFDAEETARLNREFSSNK